MPSDHLSIFEAVQGSTASRMKLGQEQERHRILVGQIQNQEHPVITKK
jgi:hypothetical protein